MTVKTAGDRMAAFYVCQSCGEKFNPRRKSKRLYCGTKCMARANSKRQRRALVAREAIAAGTMTAAAAVEYLTELPTPQLFVEAEAVTEDR